MTTMQIAVEFTFLPDRVEVGFVGTGTAIGGVLGGLWAYLLGYSLEQIANQAAIVAVVVGTIAGLFWLLGLSGTLS